MSKFNIVSLMEGVYWVEIKEADLRILCAAPADSVKHMMKNGLMQSTFKDGYFIESGPNAILLSDVMIQNGSFSNLSEFPVLQMLYRQGLLIPGHPNNTGQKPLLIGAQEQISLQLDYILRGNYGLLSREEILDCNITEEFADEVMNIKLKFAFGKINSSDKLLDSIVVAKNDVEIKNGVRIEREELNKFLISYKGESHTIDLNLVSGSQYKSAYSLKYHNLPREHFAVIHSGEGDGWDINRPCMSSILMSQGKIYLIDAGPNLDNILNALGISVNEIEAIFHTHSHDDHFSGLTSLLQADHKIKYYATTLVRSSVSKKFAALLGIQEEDFGRYFDVYDLDFDEWNNIDSLEVMPLFSPHPVETNIFHFRTMFEDGYKSYAHYADLTSFSVLKSMVSDANTIGMSQARYDTTIEHYLKPASIKKLDIGGGMIHGEIEDYISDTSDKVILAHSSKDLTKEEELVGTSAAFGTMDILVPSCQNYNYVLAFKSLKNYFPHFKESSIRNLINNPIKIFNPKSVLMEKGLIPTSIYLVLNGNVEIISPYTDKVIALNAGILVGEVELLTNKPMELTYKTKSYVKVLCISAMHFKNFMNEYDQTDIFVALQEKRRYLMESWLLGESLTRATVNLVNEEMEPIRLNRGETIHTNPDDSCIYIVCYGKLNCSIANIDLYTIEAGDNFGEHANFKKPQIISIRAKEDTKIYKISLEVVKSIPHVQWKLYEVSNKRFIHLLNNIPSSKYQIDLDDVNCSSINKIDTLHQHLLNSFNILSFLVAAKTATLEETYDALNGVLLSATNHFYIEGALYIQYNHPNYKEHRKEHKVFIKLLKDALQIFKEDQSIDLQMIKNWIDAHFEEDKQMAIYLMEKGIF